MGPRCLKPMKRHGRDSDPDPVCWRPRGHEDGGRPASERHLSRRAYLNELERGRRADGRRRAA
jgi:hypothetical protein